MWDVKKIVIPLDVTKKNVIMNLCGDKLNLNNKNMRELWDIISYPKIIKDKHKSTKVIILKPQNSRDV